MRDSDILSKWRRDFSETPPVSWLLREVHPERWLRIHSLPESKRYAGTEAEMVEVLHRYNVVASDIMGGASCALFTGEFDERPNEMWAIPQHDAGEAPWWLNLSVEPVDWELGAFDDLLCGVANDESGPVLFYAIGQGRAFSPYDGGTDIFFASEVERDEQRKQYASWLSVHPSGL